MKVLHIINELNKGGAEQLLVNMLPYFIDQTDEIALLQLSGRNAQKEYIDTLSSKNVRIYTLSNGSVRNPLLIQKLKRFIGQSDFDIVHVHLFPALYWVAIAQYFSGNRKAKIVFTEHSTQNKRINNKIFKAADRYIYKRYETIVAISLNIKSVLTRWLGKNVHIEVIRNGVALDFIDSLDAYPVNTLSEITNTTTSKKLIMMTARFVYPKDQQTVIRAVTFLPNDFDIIFAGDGNNLHQAMNLSAELNVKERVHFLGHRFDIIKLMKSVYINVLSSYYEGMSGVTIEALASGIPFIGSDVPGINDIVPNKDFLFETGNAKNLADKIMDLGQNPDLYTQMGKLSRQHVKQFDMGNMVKEHIALYKRLLYSDKANLIK